MLLQLEQFINFLQLKLILIPGSCFLICHEWKSEVSKDTEEWSMKYARYGAYESQIYQYKDNLDSELFNIRLPGEVLNCDHINCFDESDLHQINDFGEEIYLNAVCQQVTSAFLVYGWRRPYARRMR